MLSIDHPFIIKMVKSFKNEYYVFLLMEYVNGITLGNIISKYKKLNLKQSKFYLASIIMTIDYLHRKRIIHRDIKPSNIMLDNNGYIKLIDFGASKILKDTLDLIEFGESQEDVAYAAQRSLAEALAKLAVKLAKEKYELMKERMGVTRKDITK